MQSIFDIAVGGLIFGGLYAVIAMGLNLQYGLMHILNLGHGEFLMLGAYLTFWVYALLGLSPVLSLFLSGPTMFGIGLLVHRTLISWLVRKSETAEALENNSLLVSLGLMFVIQNLALMAWGSNIRTYTYLDQQLGFLGATFTANRLLAFSLAIVIGLATYFFLQRARLGKAVRALMQDQVMAQTVGIKTVQVHALTFAFGVALAGLAGSLVSMIVPLSPFMGLPFTIIAFIVIILGGLGNILGSLIGGLMLGLVEKLGIYFTAPDLGYVIIYGFFIIVLLFWPKGILKGY